MREVLCGEGGPPASLMGGVERKRGRRVVSRVEIGEWRVEGGGVKKWSWRAVEEREDWRTSAR